MGEEAAVQTTTKTAADVADKALEMVDKNMDAFGSAIKTLAEKAMEGGGDLISVLQKEIPDVLTQLIHWKMAETGINALFSIGVIYLLYFGGKKLYGVITSWIRKFEANTDNEGESFWNSEDRAVSVIIPCVLYLLVSGIIFFPTLSAAKENVLLFFQLLLAPKVYILQYLSQYF